VVHIEQDVEKDTNNYVARPLPSHSPCDKWGVFKTLGIVGEAGKTSAQLTESAGADQRLVGKTV
jgi:hypothetical protein